MVVKSSEVIPHMKSKLQTGVITTYSNPPAHGARIAAAILNEKALNDEWLVVKACSLFIRTTFI